MEHSRLLRLPNELLIKILLSAVPDEFESLALSSRTTYNLAKSAGLIDRHNELRSRYGSWSFEDGAAIELVYDISQNPVVLDYIKSINFEHCGDHWAKRMILFHRQDDIRRAREAKTELRKSGWLMEQLQSSPYFAGHDLRYMCDTLLTQKLKREQQSPLAVVVLLTMLPNVRWMRIPFCDIGTWNNVKMGGSDERPFECYRRIFTSIVEQTTRIPNASLAKLECIEFYGNGINKHEAGAPLDQAVPFLFLPAMRKCKIISYEQNPTMNSYTSPLRLPQGVCCTLQEFYAEDVSVDETETRLLLERMPKLKSLTWINRRFYCCESGMYWDANGFVAILTALPLNDSLETLRISYCGWWPLVTTIASFKAFKKLTYLAVHVGLLRGDPTWSLDDLAHLSNPEHGGEIIWDEGEPSPWGPVRRLGEVLPTSIEVVDIGYNGPENLKSEEVDGLLDSLNPEPSELPHLKEIRMRMCVVDEEDSFEGPKRIEGDTITVWKRGAGRQDYHHLCYNHTDVGFNSAALLVARPKILDPDTIFSRRNSA